MGADWRTYFDGGTGSAMAEEQTGPDPAANYDHQKWSHEMMSKYWIMKLVNDSTAVRVPVTVGEKSGLDIQILSPEFDPGDRIISKGNYGLPDTVMVSVGKPGLISKNNPLK